MSINIVVVYSNDKIKQMRPLNNPTLKQEELYKEILNLLMLKNTDENNSIIIKPYSIITPILIMKKIIPSLAIYYRFGQKAHKIDSIQTEKDAEIFIRSFGENYQKFKIRKVADYNATYEAPGFVKTADLLKINKAFYKADFDHNGLTDIMIIGTYYDNFYIFIAMDNGEIILN